MIAWVLKNFQVPVMKGRIAAICRFWRACVRQDKPACERHNLIFVRIEFVFLSGSQLASALALKA
jgi:hypothetical protein